MSPTAVVSQVRVLTEDLSHGAVTGAELVGDLADAPPLLVEAYGVFGELLFAFAGSGLPGAEEVPDPHLRHLPSSERIVIVVDGDERVHDLVVGGDRVPEVAEGHDDLNAPPVFI
jgi:hypothetical protein